jgi:hypothetical protein
MEQAKIHPQSRHMLSHPTSRRMRCKARRRHTPVITEKSSWFGRTCCCTVQQQLAAQLNNNAVGWASDVYYKYTINCKSTVLQAVAASSLASQVTKGCQFPP